jgi:hypothetical protein
VDLTDLDPEIPRRPFTNREKERLWSPFVTLVTHPLARHSDFDSFMREELREAKTVPHDELFYRFYQQKRIQFMLMSVYLIPLNDVQKIIERDFPALAGPVLSKKCIKLDTKDIVGDDSVSLRDEEADRFMDCWRKVAREFSVHGR